MTISETIFNSKFDAMLKEMKAIKELLQIIARNDEQRTPPQPSPKGREEEKHEQAGRPKIIGLVDCPF